MQKNGENVREKLFVGVPQVSILGPPLFNIFTNVIFPFLQGLELVNYADGIAIYTSDRSIKMPSIPEAMSLLFCLNGLTIIP